MKTTLCVFASSAPSASSSVFAAAQQPAGAPVYTAAQAAAGRAAYEASCASCHVADLGGRNEAPQLAGSDFMNVWRTQGVDALFGFIRSTMPPGGARLSDDQYLSIVAYILQSNGAAAGAQPLVASTTIPIGSIATGQRPSAQAHRPAPAEEPDAAPGQPNRQPPPRFPRVEAAVVRPAAAAADSTPTVVRFRPAAAARRRQRAG